MMMILVTHSISLGTSSKLTHMRSIAKLEGDNFFEVPIKEHNQVIGSTKDWLFV